MQNYFIGGNDCGAGYIMNCGSDGGGSDDEVMGGGGGDNTIIKIKKDKPSKKKVLNIVPLGLVFIDKDKKKYKGEVVQDVIDDEYWNDIYHKASYKKPKKPKKT